MPLESWLTLTVAGAFLLLGIAGSPLAWAMIHLRRTRFEERMERRWHSLAEELRSVQSRLSHYESVMEKGEGGPAVAPTDSPHRGRTRQVAEDSGRTKWMTIPHTSSTASGERLSLRADATHEPALIAVPNLEGVASDRDAAVSGLKERYSAIWSLADRGAAADVIARATGQPVGQIEVILGLRKQIDEHKTTSALSNHG